MDTTLARTIWHRVETLNAVTYFAPECRQAPLDLGLRGFWMSYFALRAAPLGPVPPGAVEATFYNFHPARVRRAIPDAWSRAEPAAILRVRSASAASALRRLLPDGAAERLATSALPPLRTAIVHADPAGRPLFAANRDLPEPADPVEALWQACTTLREHRGDGHVALLAGAGLDGCEVHVLLAAAEGIDPELFQQSRGWSAGDWTAAVERLTSRDLLSGTGDLTAAGHELRAGIERRTDELALAPYTRLGDQQVDELLDLLTPAAEQVASGGDVVYPNPMGLPREGPA